jgi:hypothetical protein
MSDPLKPSAALLCKLGSAVVHADELLSPSGHDFDRHALHSALNDPEVKEWLAQMGKMAMVPLKRTP